MHDYIEERALEIGKYIVSSKTTVRDAAKIFGVCKSTVHKDVTERLPSINGGLALQVRDVLDTNISERHLRGGRATKMKYRGEYSEIRKTSGGGYSGYYHNSNNYRYINRCGKELLPNT